MELSVVPLTTEHWPALEDLFGRGGASNGCWCLYWLVGPEYHRRPREENRDALRVAAVHGPPPGLLALDGEDRAVGWCRLTPRSELGWLDGRPALPRVDGRPVWSLACFYVRRGHRGSGVMTTLIDGAVAAARAAGAPAVEAYPVDPAVPGSTRNVFTGTAPAFAAAGFAVVAQRDPARPVMRYELYGD